MERGLSVQQLSAEVELSGSYVLRVEEGRADVLHDELVLLACALGRRVRDLFKSDNAIRNGCAD
jgi:transcriptional regulator with XRE-family HTH domain